MQQTNDALDVIIGMDVGGSHVLGAVADVHANIQLQHRVMLGPVADGPATLQQVLSVIDYLVDQVPAQARLQGIGMGVPSYVEAPQGIVIWSPALQWRMLPLKALLEERYRVPAFVENDVNLAALGESRFGCAQGVSDMVAIFIGTGIGGGLILNGRLYRGANGAAGEIGYMLPRPEDLGQTYDQFGCLEGQAAGSGIVQRARQKLQAGQPSLLRNVQPLTAKDVFQAARAGDGLAQAVIEETVNLLSQAIANITAVLNPEMVVLGGGIAQAADLLIEPMQQRIAGTVPVVPALVQSQLGEEGVVKGAVALVKENTAL